jgi:hypothetical protein
MPELILELLGTEWILLPSFHFLRSRVKVCGGLQILEIAHMEEQLGEIICNVFGPL